MQNRKQQTIIFTIISIASITVIVAVIVLFLRSSDFTKYDNPADGYSLKYPNKWELKEKYNTTSAMFFSPHDGALDPFVENVNIVVQNLENSSITLQKYSAIATKQLEGVFKNTISVLESSDVYWAGRQAYRYRYRATTDKSDFIYATHLWTIKDGKAYQFTYMSTSPVETDPFAELVAKMIKSFRIK